MRALARTPGLGAIVVDRDRRVILQATVGVALSFAVTATVPMAMFALAPLLLGVPHVASDVRYLLLRPRLPRAWLHVGLGVIGAMVALRAAAAWWRPGLGAPFIEAWLGLGWIAAGALVGAFSAGSARRLLWIAPVFVAATWAFAADAHAALTVFPHLHNLVALVLWVMLFRQARRAAAVPLVAVVAFAALIMTGVTTPIATSLGTFTFAGASLSDASAIMAPGLPAELAQRLTLVFIFTQSVHYAVWIGWIPQENLRTQGTLSFRQSARGLCRDFSTIGLVGIAGTFAALWILATRDLYGTRHLYLSLANFHGLLELQALALAVAAGVSLRRTGA